MPLFFQCLKLILDNYHNINRVRITLKDGSSVVEEDFWRDLVDKLSFVVPV